MFGNTKKRMLSVLLSLALILSLISAGITTLATAGEEFEFQVLFTSDLHGCFSDWSYSTNTSYTGLARVATKIKELRTPETILIDMGDTIQGNGTSVFHTSVWDEAAGNTLGMYPALIGLQYLKYDAWILGNHEFNFGIDRLEKSFGKGNVAPKQRFSGAILAGNVYDKDKKPVFDSYFIKDFADGPRVAVIGMTHPNIVNWDAGNMAAAEYTTRYADIVTAETIAYLKSPQGELAAGGPIDIIICAEHMGKGAEYAGDGAEAVLGYQGTAANVDLFIGAHDHLNVNEMVNGVRFAEISSNGGRLGQVKITATEQANGSWKVEDKAADVVVVNHTIGNSGATLVNPDAGYAADPAIAAADAFAKNYANTVIGKLEGGPLVPAPELTGTYQAYFQDNALVHRINEAMLYYANEYVNREGAAIASTNKPIEFGGKKVFLSGTAPLDTNANAQAGDLTRGNVSTIYKYDNNTLCVMEMTGAQYKRWMEWSYLFIGPYKGDGTANYGLDQPLMKPGDLTIPYGNGNMPGYNMDQFEGVKYKVDLTKPYGQRISILSLADGVTKFDEDGIYWVAVNNYRADSQLSINADEGSRPAVFPAGKAPAKVIAREIDSVLTVNGVSKNNGEGMLGLMIDWINRVNNGVINNNFVSNWEYITPEIDPALRAKAVAYVNAGIISLIPTAASINPGATTNGLNYARRSVTADEVKALNAIYGADDMAGKLVILHVNDAHGRDVNSASSIGTAGVAQLKKDYKALGAEVLLVSAGDAIQGTPLVNIDQGASEIKFLEAAGYDLMVPGNHEFDFGKANLLNILDGITFDVLSANIFDNGKLLFAPNKIYEKGGVKIGVFGLTTPETYTKTHPDKIAGLSFLMDENLYKEAQTQVDYLKTAGCDLIVCVGHLGIDSASEPNCSTDVIANVNGIDLFIDGHSHSLIEVGEGKGRLVTQKNGNDKTLLVSAKQYLEYVGVVIYDKQTKKMTSFLMNPATPTTPPSVLHTYTRTDPTVKAIVDNRNAAVEDALKTVIGKTEVTLYGKNTTNPAGVRMSETNLGDFAADALLWVANDELGVGMVDGAITNGGGIRDSIPTDGRLVDAAHPYGITMKDMVTVFPFGNTVAVVAITGAQLLEALEAATFSTPAVVGAFPQVSGIEFEIHTYVPYVNGPLYPSTTYYSPANPGARIKNVKVGGVPLDLEKKYFIATNDFTAAGGDTYAIFKACSAFTNLGVAMEDALIEYLEQNFVEGTIASNSPYAAPQGRIKQYTSQPVTPITSIRINANASSAVSRGATYNFKVVLNEGALDNNIVWEVNNPVYAKVGTDGSVTILNKTGTVVLTATDPVSKLSHSIILRIT